jgi:hypothetical protein
LTPGGVRWQERFREGAGQPLLRFDVRGQADLPRSDVSHGHAHFEMRVPPYFSRNTPW